MLRLAVLLVLATATWAADAIALSLAFSSDGGATWTAEPPALARPQPLAVRLRWRCDEPIEQRDMQYPLLARAGGDFASANRGRQNWNEAVRWYQAPQPGWVEPGKGEVVITLDPGARPEGRNGQGNRWDDAAKRFVDAPLPACAALGDGTHAFAATVGYRSKRSKQMVAAEVPFTLTIGAAASAATAASAAPPLPDLRLVLPRDLTAGGIELGVEALAGVGALKRRDGCARGAEAWWTIAEAQAGTCFPTLVVAAGDNLASQLQRYEPWLYHNGRGVPFATAGTPFVIDGVGSFVELRAAAPITLAAGDRLRLPGNLIGSRWVGRLGLHRAAPAPGLLDVWPFLPVVAEERWRPAATIAVEPSPVAQLTVTNAAGVAAAALVRWQVLDYFQVVVAQGEERVALAADAAWTRSVPFAAAGSDRFRVVVTVQEDGWRPAEAVAEVRCDARWNQGRAKQWLCAGWSFLGQGDASAAMTRPPAADAAWSPITLPATWHQRGGKHSCGWLVRTLTGEALAALPPGRRLLRVGRIPGQTTVWVDDRQVAAHDGHAPFSVDLTEALAGPGDHRLLLGMAQGGEASWAADATRYASDIALEAVPAAAVAQVQVLPSVRDHRLGARIATTGAAAGSRVRATVSHRGRAVLELPAAALAADGTAELAAPWAEPVLWELEKPELLRLEVELIDPAGAVVDRCPQRFGFSELRPEGGRLLLNGVPIKLRATAMDGTGSTDAWLQPAAQRARLRNAIRHGSQLRRHCSHWDAGLDAADEEGILAASYAFALPSHTQQVLDDDALWARAARVGAETAAALGNHPSLGIWMISNEFAETASDPAKAVARLQALGSAVRAADPRHLVEAACDLDLRGWDDIQSTHYPVDVGAFQTPSTYLPGAALWRAEGAGFTAGMAIPAGQYRRVANVRDEQPLKWDAKPILVSETGWNMFYGPPGGFAALIGDAAYRGGLACDLAHQQANAWFCAGHRDASASLITPWVQPYWGGCLTAVPALDAWPWSRHGAWYAGEAVVWEVDLHHDRRAASRARFAWRLAAEDGRELAAGGEDLELAPAELRRTRLAFTAPAVAAATRATLTLQLRSPAGDGAPRSFPVSIHPRQALAFPADGVALFDPAGTTAEALARLGWRPPRLARPDAAALKDLRLLVVGEDAGADPALVAAGAAVQAFVNGGGAVLALRQTAIDPAWAGTAFQVTAKRTSQPFIRAANHPVLAGLRDADLHFWGPDHLVSSGDLLKPAAGDFTCLTDAALGRAGQDYVQLLDWRSGDGRLVLCQLALAPRLGRQPVADLLLARLAGWAATDRHGHRPAVVASEPGSPVRRALRAAGLVEAARDDGAAPLVVDAARTPAAGEVAAWRSRLERGGRVLVHGVAPASAGWVSELVGRPVRLLSNHMADWRGRALRVGTPALLDGVAAADLFWRKSSAWENLSATFCTDDYILDRLYDHVLLVEGGEPLTYPALLVQVAVGRGTALLDTTRWESDEALIAPTARRLAATLCANLGARLESRRTRAWFTDLEWKPVDLAPFANRALADERADDGTGGWSDQGPDCDLRAWPSGRQVRRGIPFTVAPGTGIVVLASRFRPGSQPDAVTIPVGCAVRTLNFLQSSAWTGRVHHASYLVRYADGGSAEIPLVGGVNYHDWQGRYGDEVSAEETDTFTRYAGAVPVKACGQAGAFVMQWVNPEPQRPVAAVEFRGKRQGVCMLMALTLGLDPVPVDTRPGDRAAAERLRVQARAAAPGDAPALFTKALAADPGWEALRIDLASAQAAAGDPAAAEATLRSALRACPQMLQGYADLARLLEGQRRWTEAVEVWTRSLAANPNQPEVYHARDRAAKQAKDTP